MAQSATPNTTTSRPFTMIDNYMFMYHTKTFIILPTFPESLQETSTANFNSTSILSRTNPIFTYSNSTSRSMQITLTLHRDMMQQINYQKSNAKITIDDDYIDVLVHQIQACVLPKYADATKMINPPLVAIRFGDDIYCKGIIQGGLQISRSGPILRDNKYAVVTIGFNLTEIDPYEATIVQNMGSFRRDNNTLESTFFKTGSPYYAYTGQNIPATTSNGTTLFTTIGTHLIDKFRNFVHGTNSDT